MFHPKNTVQRILTVHEVLFLRTVQDHEFVKWFIFCSLYYLKLFQTEKLAKGKTIFYYDWNIRKVMGGGGKGRVKNKKIVQEKLSKQNSWKRKKKKRNFPQDGSHFDIKSVLNIISASGIKKKLMNTFYMLQEKF